MKNLNAQNNTAHPELGPRRVDAFDNIVELWKTSAAANAEVGIALNTFLRDSSIPEEQDNVSIFQIDESGAVTVWFIGDNFRQYDGNKLMGQDVMDMVPEDEWPVRRALAAYLHEARCGAAASGSYRIDKTHVLKLYQFYLPVLSPRGRKQVFSWNDPIRIVPYDKARDRHKYDAFQKQGFVDLGNGLDPAITAFTDLLD